MVNQRKIFNTTWVSSRIFALYLCFVILPLITAVCIYIFFRPIKPIFFNIFKLINYALSIRLDANFDWLIYNVPDGLWAFSFTSFIKLVTRNDSLLIKRIYLISAVLIMFGYEFGQIFYLDGTFDSYDLIATAIGIYLSVALVKKMSVRK